jgi:hypothetical protein
MFWLGRIIVKTITLKTVVKKKMPNEGHLLYLFKAK